MLVYCLPVAKSRKMHLRTPLHLKLQPLSKALRQKPLLNRLRLNRAAGFLLLIPQRLQRPPKAKLLRLKKPSKIQQSLAV